MTKQIEYLLPPDYHGYPFDANGILSYWDFAFDLGEHFGTKALSIQAIDGPFGQEGRVVWCARKMS